MKEVLLSRGLVALIDDGDYESVIQYKWHATTGRAVYARRQIRGTDGKQRAEYLHRFLMSPPSGMEVDHRNGDGLDCRRSNMRIVNHRENMLNRKIQRTSGNRYKGIKRDGKRWAAQIRIGGRRLFSCGHLTPESAAKAYDAWAVEFHGEYARVNFPT